RYTRWRRRQGSAPTEYAPRSRIGHELHTNGPQVRHDAPMTHEPPLVGGMDPRYAPVRIGDTARRSAGSDRG
ncbi:MAG: hypothetical protein ABIP77_10630, partial [Candidatus Limnocylindrales bacterium]